MSKGIYKKVLLLSSVGILLGAYGTPVAYASEVQNYNYSSLPTRFYGKSQHTVAVGGGGAYTRLYPHEAALANWNRVWSDNYLGHRVSANSAVATRNGYITEENFAAVLQMADIRVSDVLFDRFVPFPMFINGVFFEGYLQPSTNQAFNLMIAVQRTSGFSVHNLGAGIFTVVNIPTPANLPSEDKLTPPPDYRLRNAEDITLLLTQRELVTAQWLLEAGNFEVFDYLNNEPATHTLVFNQEDIQAIRQAERSGIFPINFTYANGGAGKINLTLINYIVVAEEEEIEIAFRQRHIIDEEHLKTKGKFRAYVYVSGLGSTEVDISEVVEFNKEDVQRTANATAPGSYEVRYTYPTGTGEVFVILNHYELTHESISIPFHLHQEVDRDFLIREGNFEVTNSLERHSAIDYLTFNPEHIEAINQASQPGVYRVAFTYPAEGHGYVDVTLRAPTPVVPPIAVLPPGTELPPPLTIMRPIAVLPPETVLPPPLTVKPPIAVLPPGTVLPPVVPPVLPVPPLKPLPPGIFLPPAVTPTHPVANLPAFQLPPGILQPVPPVEQLPEDIEFPPLDEVEDNNGADDNGHEDDGNEDNGTEVSDPEDDTNEGNGNDDDAHEYDRPEDNETAENELDNDSYEDKQAENNETDENDYTQASEDEDDYSPTPDWNGNKPDNIFDYEPPVVIRPIEPKPNPYRVSFFNNITFSFDQRQMLNPELLKELGGFEVIYKPTGRNAINELEFDEEQIQNIIAAEQPDTFAINFIYGSHSMSRLITNRPGRNQLLVTLEAPANSAENLPETQENPTVQNPNQPIFIAEHTPPSNAYTPTYNFENEEYQDPHHVYLPRTAGSMNDFLLLGKVLTTFASFGLVVKNKKQLK